MSTPEGRFKANLVKKIRKMFPGCFILKNDANYLQGVPDMLILFCDRWATLEVKPHKPAPSDFEPNQEWYIEEMDRMSFSACIYPENEKDVLRDLQSAFSP